MVYSEAFHVMCAFQLRQANGLHNQDLADDGEHGAGWHLLNILKRDNQEENLPQPPSDLDQGKSSSPPNQLLNNMLQSNQSEEDNQLEPKSVV